MSGTVILRMVIDGEDWAPSTQRCFLLRACYSAPVSSKTVLGTQLPIGRIWPRQVVVKFPGWQREALPAIGRSQSLGLKHLPSRVYNLRGKIRRRPAFKKLSKHKRPLLSKSLRYGMESRRRAAFAASCIEKKFIHDSEEMRCGGHSCEGGKCLRRGQSL